MRMSKDCSLVTSDTGPIDINGIKTCIWISAGCLYDESNLEVEFLFFEIVKNIYLWKLCNYLFLLYKLSSFRCVKDHRNEYFKTLNYIFRIYSIRIEIITRFFLSKDFSMNLMKDKMKVLDLVISCNRPLTIKTFFRMFSHF